MSVSPNFVAREYVRSFAGSLQNVQVPDLGDISPRERLEDALKDESDRQDILAALLQQAVSSLDTSSELKRRLDELAITVSKFNKAFPEIGNENGSSRSLSWEALRRTMSQLQAKHDISSRKGLSGKSKKYFHNACETIHDHMAFLKLLPQGEKYTAPITGTLEVIVKASVNHERVGKEFAAALEEIDDIVRAVRRDLLLYQPEFMITLGVQLCCNIIDFVGFLLRWHLSKPRNRLTASFNENLSSHYQDEIVKIRRLSEAIARGKRHCSEVEVRGIGRNLNEVKIWVDDIRLILQDSKRQENERWAKLFEATELLNQTLSQMPAQVFAKMSQMLMGRSESGNAIGNPMKQMIDREAQQFSANISTLSISQIDQQQPRPDLEVRGVLSRPDVRSIYHRGVEVENASQRLNKFFNLANTSPREVKESAFLEGEVVERLETWTAQTSSCIFCVFGPNVSSGADTTEMLMSNYVQAARAAGIPCISYFCTVTHQPPPPPRTRETIGLVALMYGLLRQLTLHVSVQLPARPELHEGQFEALDGTLRTWQQALPLFKDLIAVTAPPYLLIAIHGMEQLEETTTLRHLNSLLKAVRELLDRSLETGPKVKILLATSGASQVLHEALNEDEICDISRGSAGRRPGRSGKGRRRFAELGLRDA